MTVDRASRWSTWRPPASTPTRTASSRWGWWCSIPPEARWAPSAAWSTLAGTPAGTARTADQGPGRPAAVRPGSQLRTLTVTGTGLSGTTIVSFGGLEASAITVNGAGTALTATAPAEGAAKVNVTVVTPGGTSAVVAADGYTYQAVPSTASMSPSAGPLGGGTTAPSLAAKTHTSSAGADAITIVLALPLPAPS